MKLYGDTNSGNCYKVLLVGRILNIKIDLIPIDILKGETKTPEFLEKNPNGKIPLLELDDGRYLSESNAIINFLAEDSYLIPKNSYERHKVLQWQFFEQYSHEPFIAVARFIRKYLGMPEDKKNEFESKQLGGNNALAVLEKQLGKTSYLIGETFTTADISLYAYTHVAEEGGFKLDLYPNVKEWLKRIEKISGGFNML